MLLDVLEAHGLGDSRHPIEGPGIGPKVLVVDETAEVAFEVPDVDGVESHERREEADVGLTKIVPFLVEDELLRLGAIYSKVKNWGVYTITDGLLITGQNPASSGPAAKVLIDALKA